MLRTVSALRLTETLMSYDGEPVLAEAEDGTSTCPVLFVDEGPAVQIWLVAPISAPRLRDVRSGTLPLRRAFTHPDGMLRMTVNRVAAHDMKATTTWLAGPAPEAWLPDPDVRLRPG